MTLISLFSNKFQDHFVVLRGGFADIATIATDQDREDATINWTGSGLVLGPGGTFGGFGQKGQLRRGSTPPGFLTMIATFDGNRIHEKFFDGIVDPERKAEVLRDSTFILEKGLIDPNQVSFRWAESSDIYIVQRNFQLFAQRAVTPDDFQAATFRMTNPLNAQNQ
ncbi:AbfB domain-containing protein [Mycolicibacterium confluentis]|uniref:Alpha-L-arabinofuranosidase B arabinose-binding domain-containing protein n=1 Tax=Mycolicibacterium confluentis TaxID=28047 RepID=A0A7I7XWF3_9MYCO|nr:AbfB domain-containing protein [Mycolicibacterium confluentis]MCV7321813.1 AbfB domain-containing protein [Mycolicibacterium confluentis]ORV32073.1 hypothetical protein AWB99_10445 [Mycolicibacterium confluentis]BBZ33626.1 hypothetical protein MCNF_22310 [Mycolicibacterium confluentis]